MAKIDEKIVSSLASRPSTKTVDKQLKAAKNTVKQQKLNVNKPAPNKVRASSNRTGRK